MRISIPKEIKAQEGRVALLPRHVKALVAAGHQVTVEQEAFLMHAHGGASQIVQALREQVLMPAR